MTINSIANQPAELDQAGRVKLQACMAAVERHGAEAVIQDLIHNQAIERKRRAMIVEPGHVLHEQLERQGFYTEAVRDELALPQFGRFEMVQPEAFMRALAEALHWGLDIRATPEFRKPKLRLLEPLHEA